MTTDIDAIRQREQAATPGPWKTGDRFGNRTLGSSVVVPAGDLPPVRLDPHRNGRADAEFIAHARQDIPALLAEVERLRADIAEKERREDRAAKKVNGLQTYVQDSLTLGTAEVRNLSIDLAAIHDELAEVAR